jgi:hypothetical protein
MSNRCKLIHPARGNHLSCRSCFLCLERFAHLLRHSHAGTLMFANAASVLTQSAAHILRFGVLLAASSLHRARRHVSIELSPVWVLPPSWCACHTLWNSGSSFQHPPWPALTSTSAVVCFQGVPLVKNLTVSSTWTPTAAMPSAFYWPLLVPCAPAGLRRQLTRSLGPV